MAPSAMMFDPQGNMIQPTGDNVSPQVLSGQETNAQLDQFRNNVFSRVVIGWPLKGGIPIATALAPMLTNSGVDLVQQASADANNADFGFSAGQSPWNNLIGANKMPLRQFWPKMSGLYIGPLWDGSTNPSAPMLNFISLLTQALMVQIKKGSNTESYIPGMLYPPGIGFERSIAATNANLTATTEQFGPLTPLYLREHLPNDVWNTSDQLSFLVQVTSQANAHIKTLTSQLTPPMGTMIAMMVYGIDSLTVTTSSR